MALSAGWLTYKTGGLEAAIALHAINNMVAVLLSWHSGAGMDTQASGTVGEFVVIALTIGVYTAIIEVLRRRFKVQNRYQVRPRAAFSPNPAYGAMPIAMSPGPQPSNQSQPNA